MKTADIIISKFARQGLVIGHWMASRMERGGEVEEAGRIRALLVELEHELRKAEER